MNLSYYIEELLYTNDCVIIPTIGGFIVNYTASSIDFIEQQIQPPRKLVSFNPKLVNNDGLLVNFIAQKEHISYKQATQKVELYSQQIESNLFQNKTVHFDKIGKLYFNSDSKLEFVPEKTNFLKDAYGLPEIGCAPVLRNKDYLVNDPVTSLRVPKKQYQSAWIGLLKSPKIAVAAAVLLLFIASPYIYSTLFNGNTTTATTIASHTDSNQTTSNASILPTPTTAVSETSENVVEEDTMAMVVEEPVIEEPALIEEEPLPEIDENAEEFVIVLGAFGKKRNADRLSKKLEKDNYFPDVTLKNGLHRVGVQLTCTPEELKTHLAFLQENYNKKAWVVE